MQGAEHEHVGDSEGAADEVDAVALGQLALRRVKHLLQLGRIRVRCHVVHLARSVGREA